MQIVMVEGTKFLSKVIMSFINHRVSHCAMRYSNPEDRWIVHSSIGGVRPDWWDLFQVKYKNGYFFTAKFSCADQALDNVVQKIGHKDYDYWGLVGFGLILALRKIGIKIDKNPLGSGGAYLCTEAIVEFFKECNRLQPELSIREFDSELTDPGELLEYLKMRVDIFEYAPEVVLKH